MGDGETILHIWLAQGQSLGGRVLQLDENSDRPVPTTEWRLSKFVCPNVLGLLLARLMTGAWAKVSIPGRPDTSLSIERGLSMEP